MQPGVRALHVRPGVGLAANVVQRSALRFSRLVVERPALIVLRHGTKTLQSRGRRWTVHGGEAVVLAGGQSFDVTNRLSRAGLFEARWLVWEPAVLEAFASTATRAPFTTGAKVLRDTGAAFDAAFDRAGDAVSRTDDLPDDVARHRVAELLVWLSSFGIRFAVPKPATVASRLRALFAGAPADDWTVPHVAGRLAMSEATLRRRLHAEGTSFSDLLADTRMSFAMTLLQSTDRPVAHIASDVGYDSASRFAMRFRDRFGFAPTAIRGHRRAGA